MSLVKIVRDGYDSNKVSGSGWSLEPLAPERCGPALRKKLMEEVSEYLESHEPEELADIYEVVPRPRRP